MNDMALNHVAGIIGDPARSAMLIALLAGRALTAGELSMIAETSPQNASGHLNKLLQAELVAIEVQGRHRYYRLSSPDVAHALESLAALCSEEPLNRPESPQLSGIRFCRTCYDHLAGKLAVEIASSLVEHDALRENRHDFLITRSGVKFFSKLDIDVRRLSSQRRALALRCLDWTERRAHISGALGAAILRRLSELKWIAPVRGSRAVRLTLAGQERMPKLFGLKNASFGSERLSR